jgi:hypothetical protein
VGNVGHKGNTMNEQLDVFSNNNNNNNNPSSSALETIMIQTEIQSKVH